MCHEEWVSVRARLSLKGEDLIVPIGLDARDTSLAWAPPGLPPHKVSSAKLSIKLYSIFSVCVFVYSSKVKSWNLNFQNFIL